MWVDPMNLIQVLKALAINKKYLEYNNVIFFLIKAILTSHGEPTYQLHKSLTIILATTKDGPPYSITLPP
jgi:hypothetical protein